MALRSLHLLLVGLLSTSLSFVLAQENGINSNVTVPGAFIVEFHQNEDTSSFYNHIDSVATTRTTFDYTLFQGVSIQFNDLASADSNVSHLNTLDSVKQIWPVKFYTVPQHEVISVGPPAEVVTDSSPVADTKRATGSVDTYPPHVMTQIDKLQNQGYTGAGIKIGIIDTGVDYNHPLLGGCFGPGCLVSYGTDLVGDAYNGNNAAVPDNDPYDNCEGHGTHVAGIIAAKSNQYGFIGAAPGVTLGMFRVFGCTGTTSDDILIHAFSLAYAAGSDIITASLGRHSGWTESPYEVVVSRIVDSGTPVTISAGNDGDQGLFNAAGAADAKGVTSVASFDSVTYPIAQPNAYYTQDGGAKQLYQFQPGTPGAWSGADSLPLYALGFDTTNPSDACNALPTNTPDLSGYVVLIRRGTCAFSVKAGNAAAKGAKYVIFYNNVAGFITPTGAATGILAIGMITNTQGAAWISQLQAGHTIRLDFADNADPTVSYATIGSAGMVSTYTTWGPTYELDIKPQAGAVGGNILSTYPLAMGGYAVLSGTSMSCPMMAGIIALIKTARTDNPSPAVINNLISSNANPQIYYPKLSTPLLAPVPQQGAGLVQAYDAAFAKTLLSVSSLAFNDTDHLNVLSFTITNTDSASAVTYHLDSVAAATAYTFSTSDFPDPLASMKLDGSKATITISSPVITLAPGGSATVLVTAIPPIIPAQQLPVYSGYITINGTNGDSLSLPYQGVVGSMRSTQILDDVHASQLSSSTDAAIDAGTSFTLSTTSSNGNMPTVIVWLAFGTSRLNIEILRVVCKTKTHSMGNLPGFPYLYLSRTVANGYLGWIWNGQLEDGTWAPAGKYLFKVSALRIFGDPSNPSDYDTKNTVNFTITYST